MQSRAGGLTAVSPAFCLTAALAVGSFTARRNSGSISSRRREGLGGCRCPGDRMRMPSFSREMALIGRIITARVATSHPKYDALSVAPLKRIQREIAVLVDIGVGEMMIDAGRTTLDLIREIVEARLGSNHCPVLGVAIDGKQWSK